MKDEGLLKDFITALQRNANKPEIKTVGDLNLPNELLEVHLSSIRSRAMQSFNSLIPVYNLTANVGDHYITFY